MLRKPLLLGLVLLSATGKVARADDTVVEPYPQSAPPVQAQPTPPPPLQTAPPYDYQQYPQQQYPQQQYYPPPNYYAQPNYYVPGPAPRFRTIEQPRYGLMTAGLVVFGVSYTINALSGYAASEWRLAVPIVGPLMFAHSIDNSSDFGTRTAITFLVLDALVETAGAAMFLAGVLSHHQVRIQEHALNVLPTAGVGSAGLVAFGRF